MHLPERVCYWFQFLTAVHLTVQHMFYLLIIYMYQYFIDFNTQFTLNVF
jgi:hypothetical protein